MIPNLIDFLVASNNRTLYNLRFAAQTVQPGPGFVGEVVGNFKLDEYREAFIIGVQWSAHTVPPIQFGSVLQDLMILRPVVRINGASLIQDTPKIPPTVADPHFHDFCHYNDWASEGTSAQGYAHANGYVPLLAKVHGRDGVIGLGLAADPAPALTGTWNFSLCLTYIPIAP